jgi:hypothetical protein
LLTGNPCLGLDRIGSHTEDNYFGNFRMICQGDNRVATVRRQLSRFELAQHLLSTISIERHIAKRANLGGVALTRESDDNFAYEWSLNDFAIELLMAAGVSVQEFYRMKILLDVNLEEYLFRRFVDQNRKLGGQLPLEEEMPRVRQ